jgi:protein-disulfide isomerase
MNNRLIASIAAVVIVVAAIVAYAVLAPRSGKVEMTAAPPSGDVVMTRDGGSTPVDVAALDKTLKGPIDDTQKAAIEDIVRDYLMEHPEVIRDAMQALQARQEAEEAKRQSAAVEDNKDKIFNSKNQVVIGNPDGDVTLVEFFDYNCSYCRRAQGDMARLLQEDGKLRVVLKEFPVLGPGSLEAAQVAVGVNAIAPEKYREFHDKMLADRAQASGARAIAVAESIGIDADKLREASKEENVRATIEEVYSIANSLGLTGTPSYVVGDEVVIGAVGYDALKAKIEAARACGSGTC